MRYRKYGVPIITGFVIFLTLFLTIIVKAGTPIEMNLILMYIFIGILGFGYSMLLIKFNMLRASHLFLIFTVLSGVYFYISMPMGPEALSQIAAFLGWLMLMLISLIIPLAVELGSWLMKRRRK